jgi:hypothetical protein
MKKPDLKRISVAVGLVLSLIALGGAAYKGVLKVQQIGTNTEDIRTIESMSKLDKLCHLHRKAMVDWFHWKAECEKTGNVDSCRLAAEAKSRVDRLEKQIATLEEETGEMCQ